jgi:uncharacterized membrane protein (UPF0127 family)
MSHFLRPLLRTSESFGLLIARTQTWLARHVEPAFDSTSRKQGLLGRDALPDSAAVVIAPSQAVHTFGMRFPIDVVAVGRDGRVVKVREGVGPRRVIAAWSAFAIVELAAGACARVGLRVGDRLVVSPLCAATSRAQRSGVQRPNTTLTLTPVPPSEFSLNSADTPPSPRTASTRR